MKRKQWICIIAASLLMSFAAAACSPAADEKKTEAAVSAEASVSAKSGEEKTPESELPVSQEPSEEESASAPQESSAQASAAEPVVRNIKTASVGLSETVFDYTGKEVIPSAQNGKEPVSVHFQGNLLQRDRDYTVSCSNNIEPGHNTAKLIVTGKGNYTGKAEASLTILPKQTKNVQVTADRGFVYVSWDEQQEAELYRVVYSTRKDFSDNRHEFLVTGGSGADITEGYTGGDTVYVKVCACYSGETDPLCGPDSEVKSVKVQGVLNSLAITGSERIYSGQEVTPECKVYSTQQEELTVGKDYVLRYSDNAGPGRGTVTAEGMGNYSGTVSGQFDICLPRNEITALSSEPGVVSMEWKEDKNAEGYYLLCSQTTDFSSFSYVDFDKTKTSARINTRTMANGTWYFKICSYVLSKDADQERIGVYSDVTSAAVMAAEQSSDPSRPEESSQKGSGSGNGGLSALETTLRQTVNSYNGIWSVYVKNLRTEETISINNCRLYTASEMKLFGMTAAYQAIEDGRISEDSLKDLLEAMITVSDNAAFNEIVLKIGVTSVSDWINANGYTDTFQCAGFVSGDHYWDTVIGNGYNYSSVNDCGRLLESIYNGQCISKEASEKMLGLLKRQQITFKIPSVIPDGIVTANKTGEYMGTNHDCAIIFLEGNPYILCVFSQTDGYYLQYTDRIRDISSIVFQYMSSLTDSTE